jgi:hypothetical protein
MPEPESRAPQFVYDRESEFLHDEPRSARRRRPVADWGGDELFTRMPRRRAAHSGSRTRRFARPEDDVAPAVPLDELAPAEPEAPRSGRIGGGRAAEDEPQVADFERPSEHEPPTEEREPRRSRAAERVAERGSEPAPASRPSAGGVPGRRTVVIGRSGRPEFPHPEAPFASVSRRRPPRTVAERIGGQPERIVGWAFALGLILILIAIATAQT